MVVCYLNFQSYAISVIYNMNSFILIQAEALVKAQQDIGETMGEMGLAFIKLTKFETEEAIFSSQKTLSADAKCVATAAVKASRLYRELNAQTVKHLVTYRSIV